MSIYSGNKLNKSNHNDAWYKIFQLVKPDSKILDIGCSSGKLGAALKKEKSVYVVGLDIDKEDVALAIKNLDEAFLTNIEKDSIDKLGKFDFVIMADVIEHLYDPVSALKKIKQALKPNGKIIFSIPNMANATVRIELLKGRFEYRDWGLLDRTHLHYYDLEEVQRIFRDAGLKVINTDCTIRNIPKDILTKELTPIGIEVTDTFINFLNSPEALTYQFIGLVVDDPKPPKFSPKTTSSLDSITREIDSLVHKHQKEVQAKTQDLEQAEQRHAKLQNETKILRDELNNILNSRGWKVITKVAAAKAKLKSVKPRK